MAKVFRLSFEQVANKEGMLRLDEINDSLGLNLNLVTHLRLGEALTFFLRNRTNHNNSNQSAVSLGNFLSKFKKGSKQIRLKLTNYRKRNFQLNKQVHVMQYFRIINLPVLESKQLNKWLGIWNLGFLPNKLREFIFKSNSNILGTNARIAHFVVNADKSCTFCKLKNVVPCPEESFEHIFFYCPFTEGFLKNFEREFMPDFNFLDEETRRKFWFLPRNEDFNIFNSIQKRLLSFHSLKI